MAVTHHDALPVFALAESAKLTDELLQLLIPFFVLLAVGNPSADFVENLLIVFEIVIDFFNEGFLLLEQLLVNLMDNSVQLRL